MKSILLLLLVVSTCAADVIVYGVSEKEFEIGLGLELGVRATGIAVKEVGSDRHASVGRFVVRGRRFFVVNKDEGTNAHTHFTVAGNGRTWEILMWYKAETNGNEIKIVSETVRGPQAKLPLGNGSYYQGARVLLGNTTLIKGTLGQPESFVSAAGSSRAVFSPTQTKAANVSHSTPEDVVEAYAARLERAGWTRYTPQD